VAIPGPLLDALLEICPPDDRQRERRLFDLGESTLRGVVLRACQAKGYRTTARMISGTARSASC
jgi:hypothetical protein